MKAIEQFQIRKIYAIGNALGMNGSSPRAQEDDLHMLVEAVTGKCSIKSLTYREGCDVIRRLEELQHKSVSSRPERRKNGKYESRPGGVTTGQQKKIWALMYELKKHDAVQNSVQLGERLCAIIKKEFGMAATAKNPFIWLTFAQGNNLIEILKKYVESTARKGNENGRFTGHGTNGKSG